MAPVLLLGTVTKDQNSISRVVNNPNPYEVTCYAEASDSTPDVSKGAIAANSSATITITGLSAGNIEYVVL